MTGLSNTLGKGVVLVVTRESQDWRARFTSPVVIYSLQGVRDETKGAALGKALMSGAFGKVTRLRREEHQLVPTCWLHGETCCISQ